MDFGILRVLAPIFCGYKGMTVVFVTHMWAAQICPQTTSDFYLAYIIVGYVDGLVASYSGPQLLP
jgi:hypothetical protein